MRLGIDCTIIRDCVYLLSSITNFSDGVVLLLLELLDDARHHINEDDLAPELAACLFNHAIADFYLKAGEIELFPNEASADISTTKMDSYLTHDGVDFELRLKSELVTLDELVLNEAIGMDRQCTGDGQ